MKTLKNITLTLLLFIAGISNAHTKDCVVLLHGLVRSSSSMEVLESALTVQRYQVVNQDYDSRDFTIEMLSESVIPQALAKCHEANIVNFVTHSMGGILIRYYLAHHTIENLGRVVMLGPPNKGSEIVDNLKKMPGFEFIHGPAGLQLSTSELSMPNSLGPVNFELGVIAGTRSVNPILSTHLPNPDDGKVSVESTKVAGMTDHITMPVTHTFMMKNKDVINQTIQYLKKGIFIREK